jgi:hypothetical protein
MLRVGRSAGSIPQEVIIFFSWPNPSNRTVALGSTQPLTQISSRNLPGDKKRWPERKAGNSTAISELIVQKMWKPRRPLNRDSFTCFGPYINLRNIISSQ